MKRQSIPVLYYHRVGAPDPAHLSVSMDQFDQQMAYLKSSGLKTLTMGELIDHLSGKVQVQIPAVCITFDDGFIDNLVYAHPILHKHGLKAALFVATSLIRPESQLPAETMTDFNSAHTLSRRGDYRHFLSEAELKFMQNSGVWEIYSHSHFHNQVFTSAEVTGVYPETDNHWGILSAWKKELAQGLWPVFTRGAGLVNHAWTPASEAVKENFQPDCMSFSKESEDEFSQRVENDLRISLETIKRIFPENYAVICWPWGKANAFLEKTALKVGYIAALRTDTGPNVTGMDLMKIHRFPVKKPDLFRFKLGISLRRNPLLAKIYSFLRK